MYSEITAHVPEWRGLPERLAAQLTSHGEAERWMTAINAMPVPTSVRLEATDRVTLVGNLDAGHRAPLESGLRALHPWRKGPFDVFGISIDTEWRSDFKWRRLAPHIDITGHRILDIGSGNGYFGWRMLEAGAQLVMGVDPTIVFCMQHLAIARLASRLDNWVLPSKFEDLPATTFDTVLSMGVIYHRRDPHEHLRRMLRFARPGGQVVVESLIVEDRESLVPQDRYARMRNVWWIPTPADLTNTMRAAGIEEVEIVDITGTSVAEQRSTDWMRFESLANALDPSNPKRTVEGYPAPVRAIAVGRRPELL
ncbi:MAG: tRNA 5-methoxyuridine(34)/uridine 5-oxyacetic acid(34) synthase CmoB [Pseudomonadales bacterium]|jgi:tRNA (mo5U34)-methyltransferase|nr:tRNA 5-methoxyuridine(34)/uridine 5-oxyacetic acid(34) synthase CmoB [Pseudomonadales bacterium]MDP6826969.1 tRNA 5-methoxyuridine(34)/uridine 5-oxyacetic acid(34) synthase CmoB [Pseudomonadales bacterium]MDP6971064.1 tRNA 5-methoxyuridine(34)/uridine 5-oxyacetic acid(34) synthase CmoB [Pseudomonadales bacterium]